MAPRIWQVGLILWGSDLLLLAFLPIVRRWLDPLFFFLLLLGFKTKKTRFLWVWGFLIGLVKDLYSGGPFWSWAFSFAFAGLVLARGRQWVEWEDPTLLAFWSCILTLIAGLFHGLWFSAVMPHLKWWELDWSALPVAMLAQGLLVLWGFPRLSKCA